MTILAVCGLTREAEIAGTDGVVAVAGGGDAMGLQKKLDALHGDISGVISIGLGGALSPHLKVGDVVIGERVIDIALPPARASAYEGEVPVAGSRASEGRRGEYICDSNWRVLLAARTGATHQGAITGSNSVIANAAAKAELFHTSGGALVVDMESQVAARFAAKRGLPLAVLRVISDDASHTLPPAALVAMQPDGGISIGRVLWSLAKNPLQLPALIRTATHSEKAFKELLRCRGRLGRGLGGVLGSVDL
jgi:nucleoside phosphorylase